MPGDSESRFSMVQAEHFSQTASTFSAASNAAMPDSMLPLMEVEIKALQGLNGKEITFFYLVQRDLVCENILVSIQIF